MGLNYQKYINRLKQKRQDNPEYALYKQSMQAMAEPMKAMNRSMQGQMSLAGGSIGAIGSTYLQGQAGMQNLAMQSFAGADRAGMARNDALDSQIMQLEMTQDAEQERKKNELTKSLITGAATVGGFALGGFGGSLLAGAAANAATGSLMPTPGAAGDTTMATNIGPSISPAAGNSWALPTSAQPGHAADTSVSSGPGFNMDSAMRGAQIGSGLGGAASSFVGGADYNALQQSIGDTLAGVSAISTLKTHKQFLDTFREKYPMLTSQQDKETFLTMLTLGDYDGAMNVLNSLGSPVADAEVIAAKTGDTTSPVNTFAPPTIDANKDFKVLKNDDGTISTVNTITIGVDGKQVLIPTVIEGKQLSDEDAVAHYRKTGEHFGEYTTTEEAEIAAIALHESHAAKYAPKPKEPEAGTGGTGKTYKGWQALVNKGDTTSATIKQRNVESYKERGYWYDAKGNKKTTKPPDYDKFYGGQ